MALRLTLKPHERVIVGGAVLRNGDARAVLLIENEVPVLRQTDILSPEAVHTPCERIVLALQLMYVDPQRLTEHRSTYDQLVAEAHQAAPSLGPILRTVHEQVEAGRIYRALKSARALLHRERALVSDVH